MKINTQKKTINKLLSSVLTASIIAASFVSVVQANAQTTGENSNQVVAETQTAANSDEAIKKIVISNKDDLSKFMNTSEYWGSNYKITLACDIDMKGATLNPIYKFDGIFDGCGHTISNLRLEDTRKGILVFDVAFINILNSSAEIKNVKFDNCDIIVNDKHETHAAMLVVTNHGNISGVCINRVRINYDNKNNKNVCAGGLVCSNASNGTIYNCDLGDYWCRNWPSCHFVFVNGNQVGGFVGVNSGIIKFCYSSTIVKGQYIAGGFCGKNMGSIYNSRSYNYEFCYKYDKVESTNICGGFVGLNEHRSEIISCSVDGAYAENVESSRYSPIYVKGGSYAGGFAGINQSLIDRCETKSDVESNAIAGGFVGENNGEGIITGDCKAVGKVKASTVLGQAKAGGFVGVNKANIKDSTAIEDVYLSSGTFYKDNGCGGFVGKNDQGGQIYGCYAKAKVDTTYHRKGGGFVGEAKNNSEIYNSSCKTKRVIKVTHKNEKIKEPNKPFFYKQLVRKEKTKKADFCYKKDKKAVIKNCKAE